MHGASLGLCRVLDLERAGLVVSSTDAVVLPKGKGGGMCLGAAESICTRKDSMAGGMRTHGVWERWLARGEGVWMVCEGARGYIGTLLVRSVMIRGW